MPTPGGLTHCPLQSGYFVSSCAAALGIVAASAPVTASAAIDRVQKDISASDAALLAEPYTVCRHTRKSAHGRPRTSAAPPLGAHRCRGALTPAPPAAEVRRCSASAQRSGATGGSRTGG